ncbi:pathogenesis-related protein PRB1-3-like isoform X1 [Arachis ipaensis]|uniref:pathogenesis-related protein PRB1-3-like isoform X1 n=1 Tax=Arachis ipaensis TaxID=130454 RepID=UPI000A2B59F8|nr:pathogenesis-related protein PRB1-3-like isoform X1 [Arachis ipaensis]
MRIRKMVLIISFASILLPLCIVAMVANEVESPEEYLRGHNTARAMVGVPPLKWDVKLKKKAQKFVNKSLQICRGKPPPSKSPIYGQNIMLQYESAEHATAAKAVARWVAQKEYYDHKSNSCIGGKECDEYTQVVWRETTHVGCANAKCPETLCSMAKCTIIVCLYSPKGNVQGSRPF